MELDVVAKRAETDAALAKSLARGIEVTGVGAAKLIAFYTPPFG